MHRRKSSKDEDVPLTPTLTINGEHREERTRSFSLPSDHDLPASAGPYRTGFGSQPPPSPFTRTSFGPPLSPHGHSRSASRSRSISNPFIPQAPSPLSGTFPHIPTSTSLPNGAADSPPTSPITPTTNGNGHTRRHSRLHSRNLSVFFPRPGSLPQATIDEDGGQEITYPTQEQAPVTMMPSAGSSVSTSRRQLGAGFTFGTKPPPGTLADGEGPTPPAMTPGSSGGGASRRGHHHKHSMSHTFFSFLEPGISPAQELHTIPTPVPVSPWNPISPFPQSAGGKGGGAGFPKTPLYQNGHSHSHSPDSEHHSHSHSHQPHAHSPLGSSSTPAMIIASLQFILGSYLWVMGQQIGSLGLTGLGYWVVFDSMGIGISRVLPGWLASGVPTSNVRRFYGNKRVESLFQFAQSVYLMFASVYVCKETVEHLLLSSESTGALGAGPGVVGIPTHDAGVGGHSGADSHHHHGGGGLGIDYPLVVIMFSLLSLLATSTLFGHHTKLMELSDNQLPTLSNLLTTLSDKRSKSRNLSHLSDLPTTSSPPSSPLLNPYIFAPLFFSLLILFTATLVDSTYHSLLDLALAGVETYITFSLAYTPCVVLGAVLLQTSPKRGVSGGRMEGFLRAMRDLERREEVVHLPAPHIWQLVPEGTGGGMVVTVELHVKKELGDEEVLGLTKWAWERVVTGLGGVGAREGGVEGVEGVEVTVGIVRG